MISDATLDAIWREGASEGDCMLPLRAHAALLAETIYAVVDEQPIRFMVWHPVSDQLRMSSFVDGVHARPPAAPPGSCGGLTSSNHAFGEMARLWLAGTMIFSLVWQAYELSVLARKPNSTSQGADGVTLLSAPDDGEECPRLVQATRALTTHLTHLAPGLSDKRKKAIAKSAVDFDIDRTPAGLAASSLAAFRNALIHGELAAPLTSFGEDDDDSIQNERRIRVFHDAIRLTLILIQLLFAEAFKKDDETEARGELVNIGEHVRRLHIRTDLIAHGSVGGRRP